MFRLIHGISSPAGDVVRKDDNITISSYIDLWFEKYKLTVKKSFWDSRYDSIIVIKKNLGSCRVKDVTEKIYEGFLNKIAPEYAKNTLTNIHQVFNKMIREAVRDSYFKDNPIHAVNLPKKAKEKKVEELDEDLKDMKFWEKEEIKLFLQVVSRKGRPRDLAMFLLLIYSGLRIGEAVALTWDKVDFKKSEIKVRYTLFKKAGVTKITPHNLRHTYASSLFAAGIGL
ncbi:tyrosine-type recombinase/integrase [Bacillus safensis]|uniref:tyrosine-type recombinase/integrase n=1 Tax=Bacillus safensis TaxID=561879 RepID=UPI002DB5F43F|nr:tyrosine-type recombinase/integrase [Bacillus safensis]MEC0922750.1 tyrosine-type recombinase/integrase [Bacillus safensis]MEC0995831.1 tyrosine-type recombinase/integrase [Bacillus safensis]MEC0998519.1 tyrosine-type recombinase/integrase [Bacillus safensis]